MFATTTAFKYTSRREQCTIHDKQRITERLWYLGNLI